MARQSGEIGHRVHADGELAAAFRACGPEIERQWRDLAWRDMQAKGERADHLLGASVVGVLERAAGLLEGAAQAAQADRRSEPSGGDHRAVGFDQMLAAYSLLRQAALEQVARRLGRDLRAQEAVAVCAAVDAVMDSSLGAAIREPLRELREEADVQARTMSYLSHDLRGGLNGVVLMLEVLRRELKDRPELEQSLDDLNLVRQSVQETVNLLERHAQLYRLQQGRVEVRVETVELRRVVEGVAGRLAAAARAKGSHFVIELPPEAKVRADESLLSVALQNLLDNAIKHASSGPVRVSAQPRGGGPARSWAVSIGDSGPGIAPERLGVLLDPPQRLAQKERGMGLLIAHYAGRLFGALLEGESSPAGSSFRLVVPAA